MVEQDDKDDRDGVPDLLSFELVIEPSGLTNRPGRPQVGLCVLKLGGDSFPNPDWSDFVVVLMEWWLRAVTSILSNGPTQSVSLDFMDGPYEIRLSPESGRIAKFEAIRRGRGKDVLMLKGAVDLEQVFDKLVTASETLISAIGEERPEDADAEALRITLETAKKLRGRRSDV